MSDVVVTVMPDDGTVRRLTYVENLDRLATEAYSKHMIRKRSEGRWLIMQPSSSGWDTERSRWSSAYWTEIVCLESGLLYVGGDCHPVIFSSGPIDFMSRLHWMGSRKSGSDHYLIEKAIIGTGREVIERYDAEEARRDIEDIINDYTMEYEFDAGSMAAYVEEGLRAEDPIAWLCENLPEAVEFGTYQQAMERLYSTTQATTPEEAVASMKAALQRIVDDRAEKDPHVATLREAASDYADDKSMLYDFLYNSDVPGISDTLCDRDIGIVPAPRLFHAWAALRRLCDLLEKEKTTP
jgi:hypothetical protein